MKKYTFFLVIVIAGTLQLQAQQTTSIIDFNKNWQFVKDVDTIINAFRFTETDNAKWEKVSLPHTPRIEPVQKVVEQWQGICFYRKFFTVLPTNKGKYIAVQFDAAMYDADVYLNGKHIYKHFGGFLPFTIDISQLVKFDQPNCILVKLNNQDNPSIPPGKPIKDLDFNFYGGLYRNSYFIIKNKIYINDAVKENHVASGGVLINYENVSTKTAQLVIKTEVNNVNNEGQKVRTRIIITDNVGNISATVLSDEQLIRPNAAMAFSQKITINKPKLWSPSNPYLYKVTVQVLQNGINVDEAIIKTGIKTVKFEPSGFYINDTKLNIVGTNRHQEYPYIGYALSDNAQYRDAWKIKDAGFNFVRCSHYPPSSAFLDACDELGILVMDAIPGWQFFGKNEFQDNSFKDIRGMLHRDRNHASVVLWEASLNETGMSKAYMDSANKIVHEELPFTNVYSSGWIDYAFDVFNPARQHAKAPNYYKKYNHAKPLLLAEYGDWEYYAQNAGFNQKEYAGLKSEERNSRQLRTDGQQRLLQQALNYQEAHNDNLSGVGVGDVNWLMFDYKRGYATDIESSGIMDIFRLPKFSFYFYQSQYGPTPDALGFGKPMVFIANYWNDQEPKKVRIFSNCQQVELFVNGQSLGIQKPDTGAIANNLLHPPFTFKPSNFVSGKITAIGYINSKKVATTSVATPEIANEIIINVDVSGKDLVSGKNDIVFVYAKIVDKNGTLLTDANDMIKFYIVGNGEIIGGNVVKAEAGIATILLKASDKPGNIVVTATSGQLVSGKFICTVK